MLHTEILIENFMTVASGVGVSYAAAKRGILQAIINHMNCNKICSLQACKMRAKKALQPIVEPLVAVHTFVILLIMCS